MRADNAGPRIDVLPAEVPVAHYDLEVKVGARRQFSTLTRDHLHYWITKLLYSQYGPYMTVARAGQKGFIYTYRNGPNDYLLQMHSLAEDGHHLRTTVHDLDQVAQLMWDWLEKDWTRLNEIDWERDAF